MGASPRPRYGFSYVRDGDGKPVGYKLDPDTMPIVLRIFSMLADGYAIHAAARALEDDGVPAPRGGIYWSRRTVREIALEDTYRPHIYCAHCGWRMLGHARRHKGRPPNAYYRCNSPSRKGSICPNRRSHHADQMEYEAAYLFEQTATRAAMRDLYERAVEQQGLCLDVQGSAERQATLAEQLAVLDEERLGYLRQNARGMLSDGGLDAMLAEVDEKRKAIASQIRRAEDATETARRLKAARDSLASAYSYDPVHAEWYEDPDAIQPREFLTVGASSEQIRAAYMRHGASINDYKIDESERKFRWER